MNSHIVTKIKTYANIKATKVSIENYI